MNAGGRTESEDADRAAAAFFAGRLERLGGGRLGSRDYSYFLPRGREVSSANSPVPGDDAEGPRGAAQGPAVAAARRVFEVEEDGGQQLRQSVKSQVFAFPIR